MLSFRDCFAWLDVQVRLTYLSLKFLIFFFFVMFILIWAVYAFTTGQFTAIGISYAAQNENRKKLYKEITLNEFTFACKILSHRSGKNSFCRLGQYSTWYAFIRLTNSVAVLGCTVCMYGCMIVVYCTIALLRHWRWVSSCLWSSFAWVASKPTRLTL